MTRQSSWMERRLSDLFSVKHGFAFKGEYFCTNGPCILVTPGNFHDEGGFKFNGDRQKCYAGPVPNEYVLNAGDLIVAMTEQAEGLLGSAAIVPSNGIYLHNQRIGLIQSPNADPYYLYYLLNSRAVRRQIRATSSGTKVRHTSPSRIGEAKALVPDYETQLRIGSVLRAYDDLIEVNQRRIAILEDMARRLFDEWFLQFRYPGRGDASASESDDMLPSGWVPSTLSSWAEDMRDTISPAVVDPDTLYIGLEHLPRRSTTLTDGGLARDVASTKLRFQPNDILFGKIRPYFHKVAIASASGVCSTDAIVIRATRPEWVSYVLGLVSSDAFVAHAVTTSNGTKMPRADWKVLRTFPLPKPPIELLTRYCSMVDQWLAAAAIYAQQNARLRVARDMLLPKLMSGEIELSQAEQGFAQAAE